MHDPENVFGDLFEYVLLLDDLRQSAGPAFRRFVKQQGVPVLRVWRGFDENLALLQLEYRLDAACQRVLYRGQGSPPVISETGDPRMRDAQQKRVLGVFD